MAKAVINYDKDLPEIRDRRPWESRTTMHRPAGARVS